MFCSSKCSWSAWEKYHQIYRDKGVAYPAPLVTHDVQRKKAIAMFGVGSAGASKCDDPDDEDTNSSPRKGAPKTPKTQSKLLAGHSRKPVKKPAPKEDLARFLKRAKKS